VKSKREFFGANQDISAKPTGNSRTETGRSRAKREISQIDKSQLAIAKPKRLRDKAHLEFVASQPCLICGRQPSDPHHLRFAQPRGIGLKVSDEFTVPLCRGHHRQLHQAGNEVTWWENLQIDALAIAKDLWTQTHTKDGRVDPQTQLQTQINAPETTAKN
jgi:hypothetical protein